MATIFHEVARAYRDGIIDTGKQAELLLLLSFLLSFAFIRTSAHLIRSQRFSWWPGNVEMGGTHVHHLVWGILLLLVMGYVGLAIEPDSPWRELVAVGFGIGAGLTLDEFALWLNLEDVYWSEKGRRSIDAVVVAGTLGLLVLLGLRVWIDLVRDADAVAQAAISGSTVVGVVLAVVCVLKGKRGLAVVSVVVPVVGAVGAVRLARPGSIWARRYGEGRTARARERFGA